MAMKSSKVLAGEFIQWISVIDRLSQFEVYNEDWPTILGSVDATVQIISHPKNQHGDFYSGKHKFHCIKTQVFVSSVGLLIHSSMPVCRSIHDFKLSKNSGLKKLIFMVNEKYQHVLGKTAIALADSGYQGITKEFPGAQIPVKRRAVFISENDKAFNEKLSKSLIIF